MNDGPTILRESCRAHRDLVAVTCGDRSQTFGQLWKRSCRIANALREEGLRPGDRVALLSDNTFSTLELVAGVALGGFVRVPMYTQSPAAVNAAAIADVEASAVFVQHTYAADLIAAIDDLGLNVTVIVQDGPTDGEFPGARDYESWLDSAAENDPVVPIDPDGDHIIRFSAGTTGRPKGIVHTARGYFGMGDEMALIIPPISSDDSYLAAGPLSHAAGAFIWPFIQSGARHVVMPAFSAEGALDLIEQERCTFTLFVPTMIQMIAAVPGATERDLTSLRAVLYGGSPITEATLESGVGLWGNIMYQIYAQSEALPLTVLRPEDHHLDGEERRLLRSAGKPTPNSTVTIRNDEGEVLPDGEVGEVCCKTPGRMDRIWKDDDVTRTRILDDGAIRTGDIGHMADGYLYLDDRKEDVIVSGGFNVFPAEVENALSSHDAVAEAIVVGIPHEKWGETVVAVVTLNYGSEATESELIEWARGRVGNVRRPTRVLIADEPLPKSAVGKLQRRSARTRYFGESGGIHGA